MDTHEDTGGFTLIELLVVVAIIGILAATASSQFSAYREQARLAAAFEELRGMRSAFAAYLVYEDELPRDVSRGRVPEGMESLLSVDLFANPTPIGGYYNWDGPPTHNPPGISIETPEVSEAVMRRLDQRIDDGNLASGQFRRTGDGHYQLVVDF